MAKPPPCCNAPPSPKRSCCCALPGMEKPPPCCNAPPSPTRSCCCAPPGMAKPPPCRCASASPSPSPPPPPPRSTCCASPGMEKPPCCSSFVLTSPPRSGSPAVFMRKISSVADLPDQKLNDEKPSYQLQTFDVSKRLEKPNPEGEPIKDSEVLINTINEMDVSNRFTMCLDESGNENESLKNMQGSIGAIRAWCLKYGLRFKVPSCYGYNHVVFTTPPGGTFYLTMEYKQRSMTLLFSGRDLYFRGWTNVHGSFEISESGTGGYMTGKVKLLHIQFNYRFLSPEGNVGKTRMGPEALRDAFEVLYKCKGEISTEVKRAIGVIAVHISEAARLQRVSKAVFNSHLSYTQPTLDDTVKMDGTSAPSGKGESSYWVKSYDKCCQKSMRDPGQKTHDIAGQTSSSVEIFVEIRTMLRNSCAEGKSEERPEDVEDPDDQQNKAIVYKSRSKPAGKKRRGLEDISVRERFVFDYLLEDWLPEDEINDPEEKDGEVEMEEKLQIAAEDKIKHHEEEDQVEREELEDKLVTQAEDGQQPSRMETAYEDFLNHFVAVRKFITGKHIQKFEGCKISSEWERKYVERFEMAKENLLSLTRRMPVMPPLLQRQQRIPVKPSIKPLQNPQRMPVQPCITRAARFITRMLHFLH